MVIFQSRELSNFSREELALFKAFTVLAWLLLLSACSTVTPVVPEDGVSIDEYRIGVGDQLQISVWQNPELSLAVPVRPDGQISVPLVGDIKAEERTPEELSSAITTSLDNYIRNAQVTVIVTAANSADFLQRVRITGAVNTPQSMKYRRGMTVLDLVLEAGGLTPFSSANEAQLYRQTRDGLKVYLVRLDDIMKEGRLQTNYAIRPSDILTIPTSVF